MKQVRWAIIGVAVSGFLTLLEPAWFLKSTEPPRQWMAAATSGFLYQGLFWLTPERPMEDDFAMTVGEMWDRYERQHPDLVPVVRWSGQGRHLVVARGRGCGVARGDWVTDRGVLIGRVDATTAHLSRVLSARSERFRVAAWVREMDPETGVPEIVGHVLLRGAWEGVLRAETSNGLRPDWDGHAVFCAATRTSDEWLIGYVRRDEALGEWVVRLSAEEVMPDCVQIMGLEAEQAAGVSRKREDLSAAQPLPWRQASGFVLSVDGSLAGSGSSLVRLDGGDDVAVGDAVLFNGGVVGRVIRTGSGTCRFRLMTSRDQVCSGLFLQQAVDGSVWSQPVMPLGREPWDPMVTRGFGDLLPRGLPLTLWPAYMSQLQPGTRLTIVGSSVAEELRQLMRRAS